VRRGEERRGIHSEFWWENLKKDYLEHVTVEGGIILK